MRSHHDEVRVPATVRGSALALLLAAVLVAWPAPARAHSELIGSTPRDGDTVSVGTDRLVLVFSDPLVPGQAQALVRDADGSDVTSGRLSLDGPSLEVPLRLHRGGPHTVAYRVLSADGHTVTGELDFTVREPVDPDRAADPEPDPAGAPVPTDEPGEDVDAAAAPAAPEPVVTVESTTDTWLPSPLWWLAAATALVTTAALLLRRRTPRASGQGTARAIPKAGPEA